MEIALHVHVVRRILSNISGYTGQTFTIFSPWKSAFSVDDRSEIFISIFRRTLPWQPNHFWTSGITQPKTGVFCQIFPDILDLFSQSFHHMKALYVQMMDLYFFSKFGQLPSSNLGVYAVKTCNFCRHAPAILGRSSYVTLAFRNGLVAILNFDFSRVIGKHFCTPSLRHKNLYSQRR